MQEKALYKVTPLGYLPWNEKGKQKHELHLQKPNDLIALDLVQKRNYEFHKKAFALVKLIFKHTEGWETESQLREALTYRAGYVDHVIVNTHTGESYIKAKSWAFDKMQEDEFIKLFDDMKTIALEMLPDGWTDEMIMEIINF